MDDGSSHDNTKILLDELNGVNEFLLHFNDLFCVLTQNRAIGFARGEYVVKLQDDDFYSDPGWIGRALDLFEEHPDLAIIGGRGSLTFDEWIWERPLPWRPAPAWEKFEFVTAVNEAPMWFRRDDFLYLGGFDEDFAPKYWGEQEICFRAWLAGMSVGWYKSGATIIAVPTRARRNLQRSLASDARERNRALFAEKFQDKWPLVRQLALERNAALTG